MKTHLLTRFKVSQSDSIQTKISSFPIFHLKQSDAKNQSYDEKNHKSNLYFLYFSVEPLLPNTNLDKRINV